MKPSLKLAVIGGDRRAARLAELLAADGHGVRTFALEEAGEVRGVNRVFRAEDAAAGADCVILPLPAAGREGQLNAPLSAQKHAMAQILAAVPSGTLVCAGRVDAETGAGAAALGLELVDYFAREELAVGLAVATAEGAIQLAMQETPFTLCGARVLVIGYGRIGRALAPRLRALGAEVCVAARKCADRSWIASQGMPAEDTRRLEGRLGAFDIIFNTVPALVLGETRLRELKAGCLCVDLASRPGGVDFDAASRLGVRVLWALSLPGEVAPDSAGAMIRDTIYNILTERGML